MAADTMGVELCGAEDCFGGPEEVSRKDVVRLQGNEEVRIFLRFRDFLGRYPMHCHNVVHEDHAMMLRWDIATTGDTTTRP